MKLRFSALALCCMMTLNVTSVKSITPAARVGYFFAPVTIAYGYNFLTRAIYSNFNTTDEVWARYWHQQIPLVFGFQALTYYCWKKAFSYKKQKPQNPYPQHFHITVS